MDFAKWEKRSQKLPQCFYKMNQSTYHYYKNGKLIATIRPNGTIIIPDETVFGDTPIFCIDRKFLDEYTKTVECVLNKGVAESAKAKRDKFWTDLKKAILEDVGLSLDHPKADLLWEMARDTRLVSNGQCRSRTEHYHTEVLRLSKLLS